MTDFDIVAAIRARIGAIIEAEVEGVTTVYVNRPQETPDMDMPAVIVAVDSSEYDYTEGGMGGVIRAPRIFRIILLVKAWTQGIEFEAEELCEPFFGRMIAAFVNRPGLELPRDDATSSAQLFVQDTRLLGDSGVINVLLGGASYAGVEWRLAVDVLLPFARP